MLHLLTTVLRGTKIRLVRHGPEQHQYQQFTRKRIIINIKTFTGKRIFKMMQGSTTFYEVKLAKPQLWYILDPIVNPDNVVKLAYLGSIFGYLHALPAEI